MNDFSFHERRQHPRYQADLAVIFVSTHVVTGTDARTHDIASTGLGITLNEIIRPGVWLDLELSPGQGRPAAAVRGKVIWTVKLGDKQFRAGIALVNTDFQPIALVLRSIRTKTRYDLS